MSTNTSGESEPVAEQSNPTTQAAARSDEAQHSEPEKPAFRVYKPPLATTTHVATRDLPEDYFTPSAADLKAAQASLAARTQALANAPLRTQAIRDAEEKLRKAKYPTTTIRVRFPDRTQLEKTFPSTDKIKSVYAFVRGSLREDVKPIKFILYQTPPKRELKVSDQKVRDLTLYELHLAPSSVLHLKFEDDTLNHIDVPAPLDLSVLAYAEELPIPPEPEALVSQPSGPSNSTPARRAPSAGATSTSSAQAKVPKWLKLPGKK